MKKLIILAILSAQFAFSQNSDALKQQFTEYINATNSLNASKTHQLTYPKIFESVSVQMLQDMYKNLSQNPNFSIATSTTKTPAKIGDIVESGGRKFVKIVAENQIIMAFKNPVSDSEVMKSDFKVNMNAKSVTFDKKSNSFTIVNDITVIGIQDSTTNNTFKFVNFSPRKNVVTDLFGKEVSKLLKL